MKLVHITGKKGTGKNVVLDIARQRGHIAEELEHGYQELIVKKHPSMNALPPCGQWRDHIIKAVFEECWLPRYQKYAAIFFTGLYRPSEIDYLRSRAEVELRIISIEVTDDNIRYQRLLRRSRSREEQLTVDDFKIKDLHRDGIPSKYKYNNVSEIMKMADYKILNDFGLTEFVSDTHRLIGLIEKEFLRR